MLAPDTMIDREFYAKWFSLCWQVEKKTMPTDEILDGVMEAFDGINPDGNCLAPVGLTLILSSMQAAEALGLEGEGEAEVTLDDIADTVMTSPEIPDETAMHLIRKLKGDPR